MKTIYEILKPIEEPLKEVYLSGVTISPNICRDIQIYEQYKQMTEPKMLRYSILAEKHRLSEDRVMRIIRAMMFSTQ